MKRIPRLHLIIIALVFVCTIFMTGCHGSKGMEPFSMPEAFDTSKNYEITFWAKNDTNRTQMHIYEKAIEDFEKLYPNIKVNMRLYTDYSKIYNDVITNISTNTTPNVCITYPDHIATYLTGVNSVASLDGLIYDEKYGLGGTELLFDSVSKDEVVAKFLGECSFDGHFYAIPFMRSTEACYINKTYVEALGYTLPEILTWDFIWEVSDAAAKKDADGNYISNGQKVMIPFIYKSTDNMMIQQLKQKNAGYSDSSGEIKIFNDTTKELLYTIAEHTKAGAFSTFKISSYPGNFFNAGQCIFAIDSTAGASWIGTHAPLTDISGDKLVEFETEVMIIPQFDTENPKMISQGPSVCIFNKENPQEVLASWLFAQFLLTNDVQIAYAQTEGYIPVTTKAQNSFEYQDYLSRIGEDNDKYYDVKIKASELLLNNIDNTFVTPVFNGSASLRDAAGQMIEEVTKSVNRKGEVNDEYIEKLYDNMISLYRLNQGTDKNSASLSGKSELGKLPKTSVILLSSLVCAWVLIAAYSVAEKSKNKKKH